MALANARKGKLLSQETEGHRVLSDSHFEFHGGWNAPKGLRGVERRMLPQRGLLLNLPRDLHANLS